MAILFLLPLALIYTALLPVNEEVLLLLTLGTMVYTLYNRLPDLVAPYFDGQNAELLRVYRFALELHRSQLREALALFQSEIALLQELDDYADWSLLRLNLLLNLRQEGRSTQFSLALDSQLSSLDQDRKTLTRSFLYLTRLLWTAFVSRGLTVLGEQLSAPVLLGSSSPTIYPFFYQLRILSLGHGSR